MFIEIPEYVEKFEKFATYVSQKSNIQIQFNGASAMTDGKVISLPNVMGLTEKETEFLYGLLLHEVGHIKHSNFSQELFKSLKTDHHFMIVNSLEDARIENCVMGDYEGSKEIFDALYNEFAIDPKYMARVFGKMPKHPSAFYVFASMLHSATLSIPTKHVKAPKKVKEEADAMFASIAHLLKDFNPKNTEDVYETGTKIYEKIFEAAKDNSTGIDVAGDEAKIEEDKKGLAEIMAQLAEIQKQADAMRAGVKVIKNEKENTIKALNTHKKQTKPTLDANDKKWQENTDKIQENEEYQAAKKALYDLEHTISDIHDSLAKASRKAKRSADKLAQSQGQEKATMDPKDVKKALTNEKRWSNDAKKAEAAKAAAAPTIEALKAQVEQAKANLAQVMDKSFTEDGKSVNDLKQENNQLANQNAPIQEAAHSLECKSDELSQQAKEKLKEIRNMKREAMADAAKQIAQLDKAMREKGFEGILPEFEEANDWQEADEAQKEFDEEATDQLDSPVVNGKSAFGSDVRNVMFRLQDVSDKLQTIDIAGIVAKRLNVSKLDGVNDLVGDENNTQETADAIPNAPSNATRPHLPLTTEFDRVIERVNGGNPRALDPIRKAQAQATAQLTNLLKMKFKFKQKQIYKHGQEEGNLDAREIYRVALPSLSAHNIFEIAEKRLDSKVAASVAIDISGSMDKEATAHGEKVKALAVMLSDALMNAHVRHEVIGYGAPVCTEMKAASNSYNRRMNSLETQVFRTASGASGLQNIELQPVDNADGESLRLAGTRLMKTGAKKKVLFVISDCKPFLTDADSSVLDNDLHRAVTELKRKGITVYSISFSNDAAGKSFYGENHCTIQDQKDIIPFLNKKLEVVM